MLSQEKNRRISVFILSLCMLNVLLLSAYIFDLIPDVIEQQVFWVRNDVYTMSLLVIFIRIIKDNLVKISLIVSFFVYLAYFLIVNAKHICDLHIETREITWIYFCSGSFIACLILGIYVSSSKQLA